MRYIFVQTLHKVLLMLLAELGSSELLALDILEIATTVPSRTDPIYSRFGWWVHIRIGFVLKSNQSHQNIKYSGADLHQAANFPTHSTQNEYSNCWECFQWKPIVCPCMYCMSFIWELASVKESLIEAADYTLWFLLENQGTWRERDLGTFFCNGGWWT